MKLQNASSYNALRFGPDPNPDLPTNQTIPHSVPDFNHTQEKETGLNCSVYVLPTPFTTEKLFRRVAVWLNTINTTAYYGFLHVREMRDAVDQNAASSLPRAGAEGLPRSWLCMGEMYAVQRICMCLRCACVRGGGMPRTA